MATVRMLPPATGNATHTVCERTYKGVVGTPVDVPDFDAPVLQANGWQIVDLHGAGATAVRPANPVKNMRFTDTTLGYSILYDGKTWRNPVTGAAV